MKHLFVCCDGTWATPEKEIEGILTPTNVVRFFNALADKGTDGNAQLKYYHPGVGTDGGLMDRLVGGGVGIGLGRNIMSAYNWLATHYAAGDCVYLVGFSRGAYTVRCLTGLMSVCGLLDPGGLSEKERWTAIERAYKRGYRERKDAANWKDAGWSFRDMAGLDICFLGVWDTVGALGIPDHLGFADLLDHAERYRFADGTLAKCVTHARHAVAIDEWKASFVPTLWTDWAQTQDVKELWFPGGHGDVGGGYRETGLSDAALKWMMDELAEASPVAFEQWAIDQIRPNHQDQLHDKPTGIWKRLPSTPRPVPEFEAGKVQFHRSALDRKAAPPIFQAPYWKTRLLSAAGSTQAVDIFARDPWNPTGLWLEKGVRYRFAADGEWVDKSIVCGPAGCNDGRFQLGEVVHAIGSLIGGAEELFSRLTGNDDADFMGSRREEDMPWFALAGAIANGGNPSHDGTPAPHETFLIGSGTDHIPERSGYLYAYANDAWGFYDNNRGHIRLMIERVS